MSLYFFILNHKKIIFFITNNMKSFNDYIVKKNILKNNALNIKNKIGKDCKFCAVVKANGYGIGLETVCKSLKGIADFFACACLKEALSIRVFDKSTPILILGYIDNNELETVSSNNISISVGSYEQLQDIVTKNINVRIHLQVNTGMNRFGVKKIVEYKKCIKLIRDNTNIKLEGVYSHFATKGNNICFVNKQFLRFNQFKKVNIGSNVIYHIANSFATDYSNKYHLNMVRCGFLLYGYAKNSISNKPVLNIKSKIINISAVRKGESVGYDRTYISDKLGKVAVVPIGYADGLNRRLSNNFELICCGKKCSILGRVCMDVVMIDISNIDAKIGDEVIILGSDGKNSINLIDYANAIGTSDYEVLCDFNYRRANYIIK